MDRIPAGMEVENFSLQGATSEFNVNIDGDDRFVLAADLDRRTLDVCYLARVTSGKFAAPAALVRRHVPRTSGRGIGKAEGRHRRGRPARQVTSRPTVKMTRVRAKSVRLWAQVRR